MKKFSRFAGAAFGAALLLLLLQGCLKDTVMETYRIYTPVYKTLAQARADMKSGPAQPLENIGKLNVAGRYIFLNEVAKGIHVIDNANPASPKNIAFISIPANVDLAVRGDYLYADSYSDVVVFDIADPAQAKPVKFLDNVIKERNQYWFNNVTSPDSIRVIVDYNARDTTVNYREYRRWQNCASCLYASANSNAMPIYTSAPTTGTGGSMARFTVANDYLYAVSNSALYSINIATPQDPQLTASETLPWNIETIYPFQDRLFIGSRQGMYVFSLSNPAEPNLLSQFIHATSCDPVIADEQYAYVTLRSGTTCNGSLNQLDILNVASLSSPNLVKSVPLTNPHGLAKDGNTLFICDGTAGLKVFDVATPNKPELKTQLSGVETFDVIALPGAVVVVAKDGLYQFRHDGGSSLSQLSKLPIQTNK